MNRKKINYVKNRFGSTLGKQPKREVSRRNSKPATKGLGRRHEHDLGESRRNRNSGDINRIIELLI